MRETSSSKSHLRRQQRSILVIRLDSHPDNRLDVQLDSHLDNQLDIRLDDQNTKYCVQHTSERLRLKFARVKVAPTWIKPNPALRQGRARAPNGLQQ